MSFEKSFCPSPWFHMRINNSGTYEYCRWQHKDGVSRIDFDNNIQKTSPTKWFQTRMSLVRQQLLDGQTPVGCQDCHVMEQHRKVSGRQRQSLKAGIMQDHFVKSLSSSPLREDFDYSQETQGLTKRTPVDWQIDLGNYCNSACIFCNPESSSRLAAEFKQLQIIDKLPPQSWCDDPTLLARFIEDLKQNTNLSYLHFLGGETVITPGFKQILVALIQAGLSKKITIGFTTNLTVWPELVVALLKEFEQVQLGMSVETLTDINDYVRYPGKLENTCNLLNRWRSLGKEQGWLMQLRITPTCLTVHDLDTVLDYAWEHNISVESCNFLHEPEFLRIGVLPQPQRQQARARLSQWIELHPTDSHTQIVNTRDPNLARTQIYQDATSYLKYIDTAEDESYRMSDLVHYLKRLESNRGNNILKYLPDYEDLFRSAGY